MNFGMVPYDTLTAESLLLPDVQVRGWPVMREAKIYVGLSKWGEKEWEGTLFPKGTKDKEKLGWYGKSFNCIELNVTHYKTPAVTDIERWAASVPQQGFKFCPKLLQQISHYSGLINAEASTQTFLDAIRHLGNSLGPVFIQLSENFSPARKKALFNYLASLPKDLSYMLELRHPDWFTNAEVQQELSEVLADNQIGWIITDTPGIRYAAHMQLPVPKTFVRFVCQGDTELDNLRVADWKKHIDNWITNGLQELYFIIHAHNEKAAVPFAKLVQTSLVF